MDRRFKSTPKLGSGSFEFERLTERVNEITQSLKTAEDSLVRAHERKNAAHKKLGEQEVKLSASISKQESCGSHLIEAESHHSHNAHKFSVAKHKAEDQQKRAKQVSQKKEQAQRTLANLKNKKLAEKQRLIQEKKAQLAKVKAEKAKLKQEREAKQQKAIEIRGYRRNEQQWRMVNKAWIRHHLNTGLPSKAIAAAEQGVNHAYSCLHLEQTQRGNNPSIVQKQAYRLQQAWNVLNRLRDKTKDNNVYLGDDGGDVDDGYEDNDAHDIEEIGGNESFLEREIYEVEQNSVDVDAMDDVRELDDAYQELDEALDEETQDLALKEEAMHEAQQVLEESEHGMSSARDDLEKANHDVDIQQQLENEMQCDVDAAEQEELEIESHLEQLNDELDDAKLELEEALALDEVQSLDSVVSLDGPEDLDDVVSLGSVVSLDSIASLESIASLDGPEELDAEENDYSSLTDEQLDAIAQEELDAEENDYSSLTDEQLDAIAQEELDAENSANSTNQMDDLFAKNFGINKGLPDGAFEDNMFEFGSRAHIQPFGFGDTATKYTEDELDAIARAEIEEEKYSQPDSYDPKESTDRTSNRSAYGSNRSNFWNDTHPSPPSYENEQHDRASPSSKGGFGGLMDELQAIGGHDTNADNQYDEESDEDRTEKIEKHATQDTKPKSAFKDNRFEFGSRSHVQPLDLNGVATEYTEDEQHDPSPSSKGGFGGLMDELEAIGGHDKRQGDEDYEEDEIEEEEEAEEEDATHDTDPSFMNRVVDGFNRLGLINKGAATQIKSVNNFAHRALNDADNAIGLITGDADVKDFFPGR
ncbi:MAG: hypothetical protein P1U39_06115 [Legionellaceae bacterium]|jgi:hypothetical protein|nr:hypothetical protein [Legionellaceae bacterium]